MRKNVLRKAIGSRRDHAMSSLTSRATMDVIDVMNAASRVEDFDDVAFHQGHHQEEDEQGAHGERTYANWRRIRSLALK